MFVVNDFKTLPPPQSKSQELKLVWYPILVSISIIKHS